MNYGLLPTIPKLHLEYFKADGLVGDKVIYLWDPNSGGSTTNKLIKDFIYCKHFIHPRNDMAFFAEDNNMDDINFKDLGNKLFGEPEDYVLLEIESDGVSLMDKSYLHAQFSDDSEFSTSCVMNPKYEHDDKLLYISDDIILPKKIKLVKEISTRFYKNQTIGVSYKRI
jgi:hypothetical protein